MTINEEIWLARHTCRCTSCSICSWRSSNCCSLSSRCFTCGDGIRLGLAQTIHAYAYTVYVRYFWQGNYHTYGHIRCTYTVLANPTYGTHTTGTLLIVNHGLGSWSYRCCTPNKMIRYTHMHTHTHAHTHMHTHMHTHTRTHTHTIKVLHTGREG